MAKSRVMSGILFLVIFGALAVFMARFAIFAFSPLHGSSSQPVIVEVQKGQGPKELTRILVSHGIVQSGDESRFIFLGRITRRWKHIKAGEYKFLSEMTPVEVFRVLTSGISMLHPLTVREGMNIYEIADDLEKMGLAPKEHFLSRCRDPKFMGQLGFKDPKPVSLEGYLFPDTYYLNKTMSVDDIIRGMYRKFLMVWGPTQEARARELGMSRHDLITLASIIEKETGAPNERAIIASVFYNRLKKRMRLQSDPTTIYGIWSRYHGNITKADLTEESPYNTYTLPALPIGPISNPGRDAIQAALYPAQTEFLYFVSHNDGTHEFTKNYGDHLSAVRKFQLDPKARAGKSWRDLYKKNSTSESQHAG